MGQTCLSFEVVFSGWGDSRVSFFGRSLGQNLGFGVVLSGFQTSSSSSHPVP